MHTRPVLETEPTNRVNRQSRQLSTIVTNNPKYRKYTSNTLHVFANILIHCITQTIHQVDTCSSFHNRLISIASGSHLLIFVTSPHLLAILNDELTIFRTHTLSIRVALPSNLSTLCFDLHTTLHSSISCWLAHKNNH